MRFLLRSLFVWLMALALPLQGMAAAGMQACGPMHERTGSAASASAAHVPGHEHAQFSHSAHAAHSTDHGDAHPAAADLSPEDSELPAAGHQCGACASCCPAVALPSEVAFALASGAGAVVIPAAPARVASFVPPGFERPPRAILA